MLGKQKTNKALLFLSTAWTVVAMDFRFGIIKNVQMPIKYLWRKFIRFFKLIVKLFTPLIIIKFIEIYKKRASVKFKNSKKIHTGIFSSLLDQLEKNPAKAIIYPSIYIFFFLRFKFSIFLFRIGHWRIARSWILPLIRGHKNYPDYLNGLSLYLLINFYNTFARWTDEYEPYAKSGLFLSPVVLEKKIRFLGDKNYLALKLQRLIIRAHKHKFYSCRQLILECVDALPLLQDKKCISNIRIFYENSISRFNTPSETIKSISTMLLRNKQSYDDMQALINAEVVLSRSLDTSDVKLAIFEKQGFARLLNPKLQSQSGIDQLISQQEFTIRFDVFYKGATTSHITTLLYQSIRIHRFLDIKLCSGGLILSGQNAYTQFVHVGDTYLHLFSENILVNDKNRLIAYVPKHHKIVKRVSAYCGYSDNYYHWLVECIPRFILIKKWAESNHKKPIYLIPKKLKNWQIEMLASINISLNDCLVIKFDSAIECEELFTVDLPSYDMQSHPRTLEILKQALPIDWFRSSSYPKPKKLLLMRKKSPLQRLGNPGGVEAILKQFGYENVFPESLTFREQIELFSSATHVVAIGGAAITNCMFMPKNARVLIFGPVDQIQPGTFSPLMEVAGVNVTYLACDSIPTVNRHYIGTVFNYEINPKDLIDCLKVMEA